MEKEKDLGEENYRSEYIRHVGKFEDLREDQPQYTMEDVLCSLLSIVNCQLSIVIVLSDLDPFFI